MKKTIIYDASLLIDAYETQLFRTGLYRVCSQLLKQLIETDEYDIYLYDVQRRNRLLYRYILPQWQGVKCLNTDSSIYQFFTYHPLYWADRCKQKENKRGGIFYKIIKNSLRWYSKLFRADSLEPQKLIMQDTVTYLSTYYPIPDWVHLSDIPACLIVHDLIPLRHPEWFPTDMNQYQLRSTIDSVTEKDKVICVSEYTKKDFLYYQPDFPQDSVFVAYEAAADIFRPTPLSEELAQRLNIQKDSFILSVCTLEKRKNLQMVVDAYSLLLQNGQAMPKLVLTGAKGWKTGDLFDKIERINGQYPDSIVITGYISDEELAALYSNCRVFVYPSLYEGFGLPPLEAMQCGARVITSSVTSLPEVVGEIGITVSPTDIEDMKQALHTAISSPYNSELSINHASRFSWQKFATSIRTHL